MISKETFAGSFKSFGFDVYTKEDVKHFAKEMECLQSWQCWNNQQTKSNKQK